jgi:hypothetical protein
MTKRREGTAVTLRVAFPDGEDFRYHFTEREYFHHRKMRGPDHEPMFILDQTFDILQRLAVHLDIPIEVDHGHGDGVIIPTGEYVLPGIDWSPTG